MGSKRDRLRGVTATQVLDGVAASAAGRLQTPQDVPPAPKPMQGKPLALGVLVLDDAIQVRVRIDRETVLTYAQAMLNGTAFPPIVVFDDGGRFYVADGFHRALARITARDELARQLREGLLEGAHWYDLMDHLSVIAADVRTGTKRDAVFFACGANDDHGLRRTREDVERAVLHLLNDPEWGKMSQRKIAEAAGTTAPTVGNIMKRRGMTPGEDGVVIGADGRAQKANRERARSPQVVARNLITGWVTGKRGTEVNALSAEERRATVEALDKAIARLQEERKRFR